MVEHGLQVKFTPIGLVIEEFKEDDYFISQGKKVGHHVLEIKATMFAQGTGVVVDIKIWHKRIGHVNVQRLRSMQNQSTVTGIPKFKVDGMQCVCEAFQLGKKSKHAIPHEKHVSKNVLDVIHSNV